MAHNWHNTQGIIWRPFVEVMPVVSFIRNQPAIPSHVQGEEILKYIPEHHEMTLSIRMALPNIKVIDPPAGYYDACYVYKGAGCVVSESGSAYISQDDQLIGVKQSTSVVVCDTSPCLEGMHDVFIAIVKDVSYIECMNVTIADLGGVCCYVRGQLLKKVGLTCLVAIDGRECIICIDGNGIYMDNREEFPVYGDLCAIDEHVYIIGEVKAGETEIPNIVTFDAAPVDFTFYSYQHNYIGISGGKYFEVKNVQWAAPLKTKPAPRH